MKSKWHLLLPLILFVSCKERSFNKGTTHSKTVPAESQTNQILVNGELVKVDLPFDSNFKGSCGASCFVKGARTTFKESTTFKECSAENAESFGFDKIKCAPTETLILSWARGAPFAKEGALSWEALRQNSDGVGIPYKNGVCVILSGTKVIEARSRWQKGFGVRRTHCIKQYLEEIGFSTMSSTTSLHYGHSIAQVVRHPEDTLVPKDNKFPYEGNEIWGTGPWGTCAIACETDLFKTSGDEGFDDGVPLSACKYSKEISYLKENGDVGYATPGNCSNLKLYWGPTLTSIRSAPARFLLKKSEEPEALMP